MKSNPLLKQVPYGRSHRWVSRWVFSISIEGDSTASQGNLFQCSVTLTLKIHRITESPRSEKAFKIIQSNCLPITNSSH